MSSHSLNRTALALVLVTTVGTSFSTVGAQRGAPAPATPAAAAPPETMPALLFSERWKQVDAAVAVPSSPRRSTGKYWLASQLAVTNPNVEAKFYGSDAKNLTVYLHEGRYDIWSGLTGSPTGVLLKHKTNLMDLTGLARVRALVRTGNLHQLHPAVRLADGTLVAGSQVIDTDGQFLQVDVAFGNQRWFILESDSLAVKGAPMNKVDLAKVDEVGFVDLAPGGGHGSSGWYNISWVDVYARGVPR
ncbi:MAG: hypothetical protein ABL986_17670 [Vicinamibacterales bacterium]